MPGSPRILDRPYLQPFRIFSEPCVGAHMTKIVLKSEMAPKLFDMLRTPFSVLFHPTVLAYHESAGTIYVADPYAELTVSRLTAAGMPVEVVKFGPGI